MRYAQGGGFDAAGRARREQVRLRAVDLIDAGHSNVEIANMLRVTPKSVSLWKAQYVKGGREGLVSKGHGGRQPYLTDGQVRELAAALDEGPAAHGYQDDQRWTLARIRDLIQGMFRVRYKDVSTVARLLDRAGYSWQAPARRAAERDEEKIAAWREESWPEIKS
ncbi:winged helix-turn-helix domain-containing protein [Actinospica durhamensis]|uniref:Winged helix-turn-helix domain-containing protein n=1 Tax=Actinospica durhamensis TaxID=1508375 RepID=A0A941IS89_9ACTN|nr:winged helix-turn-helix domain-containing protein [Actinospica durhamensis]MBR7832991.1 winged helix-turn-helix domain-containing protein [Actinospica durhamensis]